MKRIILIGLLTIVSLFIVMWIYKNIENKRLAKSCPNTVIEIGGIYTDGFYYKVCDTIFIKSYRKNTNFSQLIDSTIAIDTFTPHFDGSNFDKRTPYLRSLRVNKEFYTNQDLLITFKDGRKFKVTNFEVGVYKYYHSYGYNSGCRILSCEIN